MVKPLILLRDGHALIQIAPDWGAALTRYDYAPEPSAQLRPVLRPWDEMVDGASHPFALACNVLLPWTNRVGGGGFYFEGDFHPLVSNVVGEPHALHGNGFQSAWDVVRRNEFSVELRLLSSACPPFDYEARLSYSLDYGALTIALSVTHLGCNPLPYGIGFHPWLVRSEDSILSFDSSHYWSQTPDHLPLSRLSNRPAGSMDFSIPRPLPGGWINTAFEGWGGRAILASGATNLCTTLNASASLSNLLIFSPSAEAGFVCIEPLSHVPNAHGISQLTGSAALTRLEQGQSLDGWLRFTPHLLR